MGKPEKMKNMLRILKDKVSILKATLSLSSKPTTSFQVAILRATTLNHPLDPPPVEAVLALTQQYRPSAGVLLHALLQRLHGTHSAYVALKCLIIYHYVITYGSPGVQEQVKAYSSGPLFNLSEFGDDSDSDTWELSNWVRWYADVLDYNLSLQRKQQQPNMSRRGDRLTSLVIMVDKICKAPESLHYQKLSIIYEVIKLVGEDYRLIMREITTNLNLLSKTTKIQDLHNETLETLLSDLKRVENCKEKVLQMFLNKKKNDGVWELIQEVRKDVEEVKEKREGLRLVRFQETESVTRVLEERVNESKSLAVVPGPRVKRWLDVEWNPLVVSSA